MAAVDPPFRAEQVGSLLRPQSVHRARGQRAAGAITAAQLRAGNLFTYTLLADDILPTKRDVPELNMYQTDPTGLGVTAFFGFQPGDKTPFRDVRMRQAWSMARDSGTKSAPTWREGSVSASSRRWSATPPNTR